MERDYLEDPKFRVAKMMSFLDATSTEFPYRSFYVPLKAYEMHLHYNPYYLLRRVKEEPEENPEICIDEDQCVLESSDEYLEESEL